MAITRRTPSIQQQQQQQQPQPQPTPQNNQHTQSTIELPPTTTTTTNGSDYEKTREQRIKENRERLHKLGIVDLSHQLKSISSTPSRRTYRSQPPLNSPSLGPIEPRRRSSRLQNAPPVTYTEPKEDKSRRTRDIVLEEGAKPEFYTEEHEKLLGSTELPWTFFVDGYDKDGNRVYDPVNGKTCHQCRQKTLGQRTNCCKCNLVQGQFCGDCLYMRYGEHVVEANQNPNWICPPCRGICNCSLCRNAKGWAPTGALYRRISSLGFRSVAHFLILTKRAPPKEDTVSDNQQPAKKSLPFEDMEIVHDDDCSDDKAEDQTKTVTSDVEPNRSPGGVRRSGRKSKIENASVSDVAECEPVPNNRSPERTADKENADVVEEPRIDANVAEKRKPVTGKKSRGRPRKRCSTENADVAEDAIIAEKRGRGRPKKMCKTENVVVEDAPVTEKRSRGRPKKMCKTENPDAAGDVPALESIVVC